jgi:hypothetical protein
MTLQVTERRADRLPDEIALGREVAEEGPLVDARGRGYFVHGDVLVATLVPECQRHARQLADGNRRRTAPASRR